MLIIFRYSIICHCKNKYYNVPGGDGLALVVDQSHLFQQFLSFLAFSQFNAHALLPVGQVTHHDIHIACQGKIVFVLVSCM